MPETPTTPSAILAFDISRSEVRAHLILRREEAFMWEGTGRSRTDISANGLLDRKSFIQALGDLSKKTGRELVSRDQELIVPLKDGRSGVDRVCMTWSMPMIIKAILVGLMPGLSVRAGEELLGEFPIRVIDRLTATDQRPLEARIDTFLASHADLIALVGGTEGGAEDVTRTQVDLLVRAYTTQPKELRPEILFAGNTAIQDYVRAQIEPITFVTTAANIRPAPAMWDLQPAREALAGICNRLWVKKVRPQVGSQPLALDSVRPRAPALEDVTEVLAICEKSRHGSLVIDLNGLSTSISARFANKTVTSRAYPEIELMAPGLLPDGLDINAVLSWSAHALQKEEVIGMLAGNSLYPSRVPVTEKDVDLCGAVVRATGRKAWRIMQNRKDSPTSIHTKWDGVDVDNILITGPGMDYWQYSGIPLLAMLDILQPGGLFAVYWDENNLAAALGTSAHLDARIALHCMLAGAIPRLATVIAPVFRGTKPAKILTVRIRRQDGTTDNHEFMAGELKAIPLKIDQTANLDLILHRGATLGSRTQEKMNIPVRGGILGVVIDARGRPLEKPTKTQEQYAWMLNNGAQARALGG